MSHFALVVDNIVQQVIVAEQDFIDEVMTPQHPEGQWIQTSYNTRLGVHYDPETGEPSADQTKALRKNFAGIGWEYNEELDAFIEPNQEFDSWVINTEQGRYEPPIPYPSDGHPDTKIYTWDESIVNWVEKSIDLSNAPE